MLGADAIIKFLEVAINPTTVGIESKAITDGEVVASENAPVLNGVVEVEVEYQPIQFCTF
jgi:hypothetical protein